MAGRKRSSGPMKRAASPGREFPTTSSGRSYQLYILPRCAIAGPSAKPRPISTNMALVLRRLRGYSMARWYIGRMRGTAMAKSVGLRSALPKVRKSSSSTSNKTKTSAASSRRGRRPVANGRSTGAPSASKTNWARLRRMTDAEIEANARSDPDAAPELDEEWFANAILVYPDRKTLVSLRLDPEVLVWFKKQGKGYQTRINAVLRAYVKAHRQPTRKRTSRG